MEGADLFPAFRSRRNFYGYAWITEVSQGGGEDDPERRWLVERYPTGGPIVIAHPLDLTEYPMLFYTFAESPPTEEGILHFAQTYGLLGVQEDCWVSDDVRQISLDLAKRWQKSRDNRAAIGEAPVKLHLSDEARQAYLVLLDWWQKNPNNREVREVIGQLLVKLHLWGERLTTWQREIRSMKCAIARWRALQTGDDQWFHDHVNMYVSFKGGDTTASVNCSFVEEGIYASASGTFTFPVPPATEQDIERMLKRREVVQVGRCLLDDLIQHRLSRYTAFQRFSASGQSHARLQIAPTNRLGGLWLQLARSVDGDKIPRACEGPGCGTLLEIGPRGRYRTNRLYCSDACRSKAFRERQRRAHPNLEPRRRGRPRTQRTDSVSQRK